MSLTSKEITDFVLDLEKLSRKHGIVFNLWGQDYDYESYFRKLKDGKGKYKLDVDKSYYNACRINKLVWKKE